MANKKKENNFYYSLSFLFPRSFPNRLISHVSQSNLLINVNVHNQRQQLGQRFHGDIVQDDLWSL